MCLFFFLANHDLKKRINRMANVNAKTLKQEVEKEKKRIKKNLEEKYRADRESFRALYERVKLQETWVENSEEQIKN